MGGVRGAAKVLEEAKREMEASKREETRLGVGGVGTVWWLDQLSLDEPTWVKAKEKSHMTPAEAAQKRC